MRIAKSHQLLLAVAGVVVLTASGSQASDRAQYVEQPTESDAPLTCRQVPTTWVGPIVVGGGVSSCGSGSISGDTVRRGGTVSATTDACLPHGARDEVLGWDTGQEHELTVSNSRGDVVYRFSDAVDFPQGAHTRRLSAGRCLAWTGVWDATSTSGEAVPAGEYRARLSVGPDTVDGATANPGGSVEWTVTVQD